MNEQYDEHVAEIDKKNAQLTECVIQLRESTAIITQLQAEKAQMVEAWNEMKRNAAYSGETWIPLSATNLMDKVFLAYAESNDNLG